MINVYVAVSSHGQPFGRSAYAFIFVTEKGEMIECTTKYVGDLHVNTLKYIAVRDTIETIREKYTDSKILLCLDDELIIGQLKGKKEGKSEKAKNYINEMRDQMKSLNVKLQYVTRKNQYITMCRRLCGKTLDYVDKVKREAKEKLK